jgi:hypothetical protein
MFGICPILEQKKIDRSGKRIDKKIDRSGKRIDKKKTDREKE